jgi:hypothetical protein
MSKNLSECVEKYPNLLASLSIVSRSLNTSGSIEQRIAISPSPSIPDPQAGE